jgi:hypothetical protein
MSHETREYSQFFDAFPQSNQAEDVLEPTAPNWSEIDPQEIDALVQKIQEGKCFFTKIGGGSYQCVTLPALLSDAPKDNKYVVKFLKNRPMKVIDESVKRIGIRGRATAVRPGLLHPSVFFSDEQTPEDERLALRATELALQHQEHLRYLPGHVLPKQFAIVDLSNLILGEIVAPDYGSYRDKLKEIWIQAGGAQENFPLKKDEMFIPFPFIKGRVIFLPRGKDLEMKATFVKIDENGKYGSCWDIAVLPGKHVVEIQAALPDSGRVSQDAGNSVLSWSFQNFGPKRPEPMDEQQEEMNRVWDTELALEVIDLVEKFLSMYKAGVSIDVSYSKEKGKNILLVLENGKKRIVTHDTNNWGVNQRKLLLELRRVLQKCSEVEVVFPFPGIANEVADLHLIEFTKKLLRFLQSAVDLYLLADVSTLKKNVSVIIMGLQREIPLEQRVEEIAVKNAELSEKILLLEEELEALRGSNSKEFTEDEKAIFKQKYSEYATLQSSLLAPPEEAVVLRMLEELHRSLG